MASSDEPLGIVPRWLTSRSIDAPRNPFFLLCAERISSPFGSGAFSPGLYSGRRASLQRSIGHCPNLRRISLDRNGGRFEPVRWNFIYKLPHQRWTPFKLHHRTYPAHALTGPAVDWNPPRRAVQI